MGLGGEAGGFGCGRGCVCDCGRGDGGCGGFVVARVTN